MEIKTKFNVGDIAYTIHNNYLFQVKIYRIKVQVSSNGGCIESYDVMVTDDNLYEGNIVLNTGISANKLFADKHVLFKDLENTMFEFVEQQ